jgi:hypothetical protein
MIFKRFGSPVTWEQWQQEGTVIIPGVFDYLQAIAPEIAAEFDLYQYHHRPRDGTNEMGFLRIMFYSLIQQLIRQDPVYYALTVASRLDHSWRLVSYPYITKYTQSGGGKTKFLHLDLNVDKFLKSGDGEHVLSTSVSLDEEDEEGCTTTVRGFHRNLKEWWKSVWMRGDRKSDGGVTTNCNIIYRTEDREKWGDALPQPCPAYGVRFTLPQIIHGSTEISIQPRRVVFPWFVKIEDDHETLEKDGMLGWSEVAACHRDMDAPTKGVNGDKPKHFTDQFKPAILMETSYPLGDALLGKRKWIGEVLDDRDVLLGPDDELAMRFVQEVRERLLDSFCRAFAKLVKREIAAFRANSFFLKRERTTSDVVMLDA